MGDSRHHFAHGRQPRKMRQMSLLLSQQVGRQLKRRNVAAYGLILDRTPLGVEKCATGPQHPREGAAGALYPTLERRRWVARRNVGQRVVKQLAVVGVNPLQQAPSEKFRPRRFLKTAIGLVDKRPSSVGPPADDELRLSLHDVAIPRLAGPQVFVDALELLRAQRDASLQVFL
jgi:hypothetical protein